MALYKGSTKTGSFYLGSTKIGKLYKGSTLVYQSGPSIKLYGWSDSGQSVYTNKLGSIVDNFAVVNESNPSIGQVKFLGMQNGTLGESGSVIKTLYTSGAAYLRTVNMNGVNVHIYQQGGGMLEEFYAVIDKAEINSLVLFGYGQVNNYPGTVTAISDSSMTCSFISGYSGTYTRDSSSDFVWTNKAIS